MIHKQYVKEWLQESGKGKRKPQKCQVPSSAFKFKPKVDKQDTLYKSERILKWFVMVQRTKLFQKSTWKNVVSLQTKSKNCSL